MSQDLIQQLLQRISALETSENQTAIELDSIHSRKIALQEAVEALKEQPTMPATPEATDQVGELNVVRPSPVGVTLTELQVSFGEPKPRGLILPTGLMAETSDWNAVLEEVCKFYQVGALNCPIRMPRSSVEELANETGRDRKNQPFRNGKKLPSGVWLEKHGDPPELMRKSRYVIGLCGGNPSDFRVVR